MKPLNRNTNVMEFYLFEIELGFVLAVNGIKVIGQNEVKPKIKT